MDGVIDTHIHLSEHYKGGGAPGASAARVQMLIQGASILWMCGCGLHPVSSAKGHLARFVPPRCATEMLKFHNTLNEACELNVPRSALTCDDIVPWSFQNVLLPASN